MRLFLTSLAVLQILRPVNGFKFLVYNPLFGRSHVTFMGSLADALVEAGHEVVMLAPVINYNTSDIGSKRPMKVIKVPPSPSSIAYSEFASDEASSNLWGTQSPAVLSKIMNMFSEVLADQCNATLHHPGLLDDLRKEQFDAAISESMDKCGYAIFHHLGIDKVAATLSIASLEGSYDVTGNPSFPSYVPGSMMGFGERMTFLQRVGNFLSLGFGKFVFPLMSRPTEQVLREHFGEDFPDSKALLSGSSLWFLNNEPLIDFPRPISHKIIDIGGITLATGGGYAPLNETWSAIFDLRPRTVLISFGTIAKSSLMPECYKSSIREAIRKFPDVTFIWKYEQPEDKISEGIPNLIESTWVPQNDMLYDPHLSLFITHCGQGSTIEATTAGVPLIVIPVLADQRRNAAVIDRIGTGIVLQKEALEQPDELEAAIREALANAKYRVTARSVGEMIRSRPFSPKETFVRNMEFLARFGPLKMLEDAGKELNCIQYYLVDVFAFLGVFMLVFAFVIFRLAKLAITMCIRAVKSKQE